MPTAIKAHKFGASIQAAPGGRYAVTSARDGVQLWDLDARRVIDSRVDDVDSYRIAAVSTDGKSIAIYDGARQEPMGLLNRETGATIYGKTGGPSKVLMIPGDDQTVVSVSTYPKIFVWDAIERKDVVTYGGHQQFITSAVLHNDGRHVISTGYDKAVHFWEIATGKLVRRFGDRKNHWAVIASSSNRLITVEGDYNLNEWDVETGQLIKTFRFPHLSKTATMTPDGRHALIGTHDSIVLCDLDAGRIVLETNLGRAVTGCAATGNDGFMVADEKGSVAFYTLAELVDPSRAGFDPAWSSLTAEQATSPDVRADLIKHIERKYGFELPETYLKVEAAGAIDYENEMWLTDVEWFRLLEMFEYEDSPLWVKTVPLVPFAKHDNGQFCWWPEMATDRGIPVVECNRIDESKFLAPNFESFVYRKVVEYAAGVWIAETAEEAVAQVKKWLGHFQPIWPEKFVTSIEAIIDGAPSEKGEYDGLITWDEGQDIIKRDLAFDRLNEVFEPYPN